MSSASVVPYIAPWQTGFERYATQVYTMPLDKNLRYTSVVARGQWWRVIFISATLAVGASVQTRQVYLDIQQPDGGALYRQIASVAQTASTTAVYVFAPGQAAYENTTVAALQMAMAPLPDVLWQPLTTISMDVNNADTVHDVWAPTLAVEIYTEARPGVLTPAPTPVLV